MELSLLLLSCSSLIHRSAANIHVYDRCPPADLRSREPNSNRNDLSTASMTRSIESENRPTHAFQKKSFGAVVAVSTPPTSLGYTPGMSFLGTFLKGAGCLIRSERETLARLEQKLDDKHTKDGPPLSGEETSDYLYLQRKLDKCEKRSEDTAQKNRDEIAKLRLNWTTWQDYGVHGFIEGELAKFNSLPAGEKGRYNQRFTFPEWFFHTYTTASPDSAFCDTHRLCTYSGVMNLILTDDQRRNIQVALTLQAITSWSGAVRDYNEAFRDAFLHGLSIVDTVVRDFSTFDEERKLEMRRQHSRKSLFALGGFLALTISAFGGIAGMPGLGFATSMFANSASLVNNLQGIWDQAPDTDPTEDVAAVLHFEMGRVLDHTYNWFAGEAAAVLAGRQEPDGTYTMLQIMKNPSVMDWLNSNYHNDYAKPLKEEITQKLVLGVVGGVLETSIEALWVPTGWTHEDWWNKKQMHRVPAHPLRFVDEPNTGFNFRWRYLKKAKKLDRDYMPAKVSSKLADYDIDPAHVIRASLAWRAQYGQNSWFDFNADRFNFVRPHNFTELQPHLLDWGGPLFGKVALKIEDRTSDLRANKVMPLPWHEYTSERGPGTFDIHCNSEKCRIKNLKKKNRYHGDVPPGGCRSNECD